MSKLAKRLDAHFVACAAAAGAAMVGTAQTAEAGIVYSGVLNIPVQQTTNGLYINIVTGQINEPGNGGGGTVAGWDINPYGATPTFWGSGNPSWGYVGTPGVMGQLAAGATIDGTTATNTGSASAAAFPTTVGALFGFRFQNEAAGNQVQYGWGRLIKHAGVSPATGFLVEYAYENTGAGIAAGAVPAPGSLALLALGALGVAGRRRK